jgi:hypothetical protein
MALDLPGRIDMCFNRVVPRDHLNRVECYPSVYPPTTSATKRPLSLGHGRRPGSCARPFRWLRWRAHGFGVRWLRCGREFL